MRVSGAPVRRPGRAVGPPLCWEASGGEIPRWAPAADSRFPRPRVALSPAPRGGARPPRLHRPFRGVGLAWPHPVGALLRLSVRLSPLAVCRSPGPRPGVSRFPGPPRSRSAARFAAACPPPPSRAGRGGALVIFPPPRPPAQVRSPERGSGPRSCPPRAGRRVSSPAGIPRPSGAGVMDGRRGRASAVRGVALAGGVPPPPPLRGWGGGRARGGVGGAGVEGEGAPPPSPSPSSSLRAVAAVRCDPRGPRACARSGVLAAARDGGGRVSRPGERLPATALPPRPRLPRLAGLPARPPRRACRVPGLSPPLARHARLLVLASPTWLILPVAYACLKD